MKRINTDVRYDYFKYWAENKMDSIFLLSVIQLENGALEYKLKATVFHDMHGWKAYAYNGEIGNRLDDETLEKFMSQNVISIIRSIPMNDQHIRYMNREPNWETPFELLCAWADEARIAFDPVILEMTEEEFSATFDMLRADEYLIHIKLSSTLCQLAEDSIKSVAPGTTLDVESKISVIEKIASYIKKRLFIFDEGIEKIVKEVTEIGKH